MRRLLSFLASPAGQACRYLASLLILAAFVWHIDWTLLREASTRVEVAPAVAAVVLAGTAFPLMAWRWWMLAHALGYRMTFRWAHRLTWLGQFYASLLPGGLGGEAARSYFVIRDTPTARAPGIASIVWDRALGLALLFALATAALLLHVNAVVASPVLQGLLSLAALSTAVGALAIWWGRPTALPERVQTWVGHERCLRWEALLQPVRAAPRVLLGAFALTLAVWLLDFWAIALLARSLGLDLPFLDVALAGCVAYAASVLPISLGGHGVREGALLFTLVALGSLPPDPVSRDLGLLLGLLVWVVTMFWSLIGGLGLLLPGWTARPSDATPA